MAKSAYIHIPFCSHKCDFCDFTAFAGLDHMAEEYCQVVVQEIQDRVSLLLESEPLASIFYGGGTPGLVDPRLIQLIQRALIESVGITSGAEVTLETTPTAITEQKASRWLHMGVNRLSIGIQSLNDQELQAMGRGHSRQQALDGIKAAVQAGFTNLSCDLMYGLPEQTLDSWTVTLQEILSLSLPHLSAYGLTLAGNSPLLSRYPRESAAYPQEETYAQMYMQLVHMAEEGGLKQYEISNFSYPGFESQHNRTYWNNEEYLAFGVGAHRYVGGVRSSNWRSLNRYLKDWLGHETEETIAATQQVQEAIFLGLRKKEGIDLQSFQQQYGLDLQAQKGESIAQLVEDGFLKLDSGKLSLSQKGILVSNLVLSRLI